MSDERVERVRDAIFRTYALNRWSVIGVSWTHANKHGGFARKDIDAIDDYARAAVAALDEEPLQDRVGAWGTRTFPASTEMNIIAHLRDEVVELEEAVALQGPGDAEAAAVEAADVYLLLLHLAHRYGFDLQAAAEAKFAIVQTRSYTTDSGRRYLRHDAKGGAS